MMSDTQNREQMAEEALPSLDALQKELKRVQGRSEYRRVVRSIIVAIVIIIAISIVITSFFFTVLKVSGSSMTPTLNTGEILIANHHTDVRVGDLIAFYYNNRVLIKRVIGCGGDWVDIDEEGNVEVNGEVLTETYASELSRDPYDITFPYQVPEGKWFVLGDHRATSIDSRTGVVGCVSKDQIIGKIVARIFPFHSVNFFGN